MVTSRCAGRGGSSRTLATSPGLSSCGSACPHLDHDRSGADFSAEPPIRPAALCSATCALVAKERASATSVRRIIRVPQSRREELNGEATLSGLIAGLFLQVRWWPQPATPDVDAMVLLCSRLRHGVFGEQLLPAGEAEDLSDKNRLRS